MTRPTQVQYEAALARAKEENVVVVGEGKWLNGYEFVVVQNSENLSTYNVTKEPDVLACECKAWEHGQYCKHRAVAHCHWEMRRIMRDARRSFLFKDTTSDKYAGKYW